MLNKKTVDDLKDLKGKKVLVRCDFNVPLKEGKITDETRAMPKSATLTLPSRRTMTLWGLMSR